MNKSLICLNIFGAICSIAIAIKFVFMPIIAIPIFSDEYKVLMFQCDNVMRDHLIAKNRVFFEKSERSIKFEGF